MRFVIGLAIGFGVGFAGAVLFAPERRREGDLEAGPTALDADDSIIAPVKRALRSVQDQLTDAMEEARKAQAEKEAEMRARYERKVGHVSFEGEVVAKAKVEDEEKKAKGKKEK